MENSPLTTSDKIPRFILKDSVFRSLFSDLKYLLMLYNVLHPEEKNVSESDLTIENLGTVLCNGLYNDLAFKAKDRSIILMEAQSIWSDNIIVRLFLYLASFWHQYILTSKQEKKLYTKTRISLPVPELYVVYTGKEKLTKDVIDLAETYFNGQICDVNCRVHIITCSSEGDILNQYIKFCKIFDKQVAIYGRTNEAIRKTIEISKKEGILVEYLEEKEVEVYSIMNTLFDQEAITKWYGDEREEKGRTEGRNEGRAEGRNEGVGIGVSQRNKELALSWHKDRNMSFDQIASLLSYDVNEVEAWCMEPEPEYKA